MLLLANPGLWNNCVGAFCPSVQKFQSSQLTDYAATNDHMEVTGAAFGVIGQTVITFDGVNDVATSVTARINGAAAATLTGWMYKPVSASGTCGFGCAAGTTSGSNRFTVYWHTNGTVYCTAENVGQAYGSVAAPNSGWLHIAMAYSGSGASNATRLVVYINGILRTLTFTNTIPATLGTVGPLILGKDSSNRFDANSLDDVRLYDRTLTASEVARLALRRGIAYETTRRRVFKGAGGGGILGSASITEADDTLASVSTIAIAAITAITEASDTLSSAATVAIAGLSAITEAADSLASTATISLVGSASITEASDTLSSASAIAIVATVAITEASDTLTATGDIGGDLTGTLAITEADDTLSAAATVAIVSASAITEASDTLASTATLAIVGSSAITEASDTLSTIGGPICTATAAITEAGDTLTATSLIGVTTQIWTITFANSRQKLTGGLQASCFTGGLAVSELTGGLAVAKAQPEISGEVTADDYDVYAGTVVGLSFQNTTIQGVVTASDYSVYATDIVRLEYEPVALTYQWIDENGDNIVGETGLTTDWTASETQDPPRIRVTNPATGANKIFEVDSPITVDPWPGWLPVADLPLEDITPVIAISPQYLGGTTNGQNWADSRYPTVNVEKGYGSGIFQDLYPDPDTGQLFTQPDGAGVTATVFAAGANLLVQIPYNQALLNTAASHPSAVSADRRVLLDISVPTSPAFAGIAQGSQDASQHATERGYDTNVSVVSNQGLALFSLDSSSGSASYYPYRNNGGSTQNMLVHTAGNRWYDAAITVVNNIKPTTLPNFKGVYVTHQDTAPTVDASVGLQGGFKQGSGAPVTTATSTPMRIWGTTSPLTGRAFTFICINDVLTNAQAYQIATRSHFACRSIFGANEISLYGPKIYQGYPIDLTSNLGVICVECASAPSRVIEASFNGAAYATLGTTDSNGYLNAKINSVTPGRGTLNLRVAGQVSSAVNVTNVSVGVFVAALGRSNALGRGDDFTMASVGGKQLGGDWVTLPATDKSWIAKFADDLAVAESAPMIYHNLSQGSTYLYFNALGHTDGRDGHWAYNNPGVTTANTFALIARNANLWYEDANFIIWHQGESEALDGNATVDKWKTSLINMWTEFKVRSGQTGKLWVMQLGRNGTASDTFTDDIRKQQVDVCAERTDLFEFGGCLAHLPVEDTLDSGQLVHFYTQSQKNAVAAVFKRHALGSGRGPRFSSMVALGTTITITCTGGVSPLTISVGESGSPIGWTVSDGNGSNAVTACNVSGLVITLTVVSTLAGTVSVKWLSHYSGIGTTLLDSDATTPVPPEPFSQTVAAT